MATDLSRLGVTDPAVTAFAEGVHEHLRRVLDDDALQDRYIQVMQVLRLETAVVIGCCEPELQQELWAMLEGQEMRQFAEAVIGCIKASDDAP